MTDQTRRSVLKTLAYGTVLSTGVVSSLAFAEMAKPADITQHNSTGSKLGSSLGGAGLSDVSGVTIYQQGSGLDQSVSLMNLTDEAIHLHELAPISVETIDGSSRVKVNTVKQSGLVLEAGQRVSFELSNQSPALASIYSDHPAFNGSVLSS